MVFFGKRIVLPFLGHDLLQHTLVTQIKKDLFDNLIEALLNVRGSISNNLKTRLNLKYMGIRPDNHAKFNYFSHAT